MRPSSNDRNNKPDLVICIPSRAELSDETRCALANNLGSIAHVVRNVRGKLVIDARNELAQTALRSDAEYTLWLDDDAFFEPGTIERLLASLRMHPEIDMLGTYSCDRKPFCSPSSYISHDGALYPLVENGMPATIQVPQWAPRFTTGDVVPIDVCAFHGVLMRTSLLERVGPSPFNLEPNSGVGEDFNFCLRAKRIGAQLATDTGATVAHVDIENGFAFIPYRRPGKIVANRFSVHPDPRPSLEIAQAWRDADIRANRRYGESLDRLFKLALERQRRRGK